MGNNSADDFFPRTAHSHVRGSSETVRRRAPKGRMPSSAGYLLAAFVAAIALFLGLWWTLVSGGDEAPWIPAGLAAAVVLLVALSAREVVMRRAWTRYLLEQGNDPNVRSSGEHKSQSTKSRSSGLSAVWRNIQRQSAETDASGSAEAHFDLFNLCQEYLATSDEALRSNTLASEKRNSIRAAQERVRSLQKHHMLTWARDSSRSLTFEAQQRARTFERIEAANRAFHCLETALKFYPDETELKESSVAILEFISSIRVAHWVELAERSAFKGHYRRAIDRYKDALFYVNRGTMKDDVRAASIERIGREIEVLQGRVRTQKNGKTQSSADKTDFDGAA